LFPLFSLDVGIILLFLIIEPPRTVPTAPVGEKTFNYFTLSDGPFESSYVDANINGYTGGY
jgi:hypothetical protein